VANARRYVRAAPHAVRKIVGAMREAAGLTAALVSRSPDIGKIETRLALPCTANFALAANSLLLRTMHALPCPAEVNLVPAGER
jgi:hypothetical protein